MPDPPHARSSDTVAADGARSSGDSTATLHIDTTPVPDRKDQNVSQRAAEPKRVAPPPAEPPDERANLVDVAARNAPPWLVSAVVHMTLLIVLALWIIAPKLKLDPINLSLSYTEELGDQLDDELVTISSPEAQDADQQILTPDNMRPVVDPFAAPPKIDPTFDAIESISAVEAPTVGLALSGRLEGMRQVLLRRYGGDATTEAAVERALAWLAKQQRSDGLWSLRGPYSSGADQENKSAATAMALLAFLGHGDTPHHGKYRDVVERGFEALIRTQNAAGEFPSDVRNHRLYTQGQCTIALCEVYGLTKETRYRGPAEKAVEFCLKAQSREGGWRYQPRVDSDTSVTGWIVMALQSARMADLTVPADTLKEVGKYLDSVTEDGSLYSYQTNMRVTEAMTAEALLCRQYLGWDRYDPRLIKGAEFLLDRLPRWSERDVYYWYYGTQVMHHMEGQYWDEWNRVVKKLLVDHQELAGPEAGSWDLLGVNPDAWAFRRQGGRLYVTCLSIYMLEVYYRHMPLYAKIPLQR